jgi:hypothetical protein
MAAAAVDDDLTWADPKAKDASSASAVVESYATSGSQIAGKNPEVLATISVSMSKGPTLIIHAGTEEERDTLLAGLSSEIVIEEKTAAEIHALVKSMTFEDDVVEEESAPLDDVYAAIMDKKKKSRPHLTAEEKRKNELNRRLTEAKIAKMTVEKILCVWDKSRKAKVDDSALISFVSYKDLLPQLIRLSKMKAFTFTSIVYVIDNTFSSSLESRASSSWEDKAEAAGENISLISRQTPLGEDKRYHEMANWLPGMLVCPYRGAFKAGLGMVSTQRENDHSFPLGTIGFMICYLPVKTYCIRHAGSNHVLGDVIDTILQYWLSTRYVGYKK